MSEQSELLREDSMSAIALTVVGGSKGGEEDEGAEAGGEPKEPEKAGAGEGDAEEEEDGDEPLPEGWEKHESKSNPGMHYFFNVASGETVWTRPKATKAPKSPTMAPSNEPSDLHLEDIPIPPPKGAVGIIPSPKRKQSLASDRQESTRSLKKVRSHIDHNKAMARNSEHKEHETRYCARLTKSLLAEFIGTYFLCSTIALSAGQSNPMAPLAIGLTLTVMVFAFGHVSGAHFNPAVTLAVLLRGRIDLTGALCYLGAQLAGAFSAAGQQFLVAGDAGFTHGYPAPNPKVTWYTAVITELTYTFALATVVLNVATSKKQEGNSFFGLAIGMTLASALWAAGGISGGAFNPVVGTALPLLQGQYNQIWIYWLGPCLGGAAASGVFYLTADPSEFTG